MVQENILYLHPTDLSYAGMLNKYCSAPCCTPASCLFGNSSTCLVNFRAFVVDISIGSSFHMTTCNILLLRK